MNGIGARRKETFQSALAWQPCGGTGGSLRPGRRPSALSRPCRYPISGLLPSELGALNLCCLPATPFVVFHSSSPNGPQQGH